MQKSLLVKETIYLYLHLHLMAHSQLQLQDTKNVQSQKWFQYGITKLAYNVENVLSFAHMVQ